MKPLRNYINIKKKPSTIIANNDNLQKIVLDQINAFGRDADMNHIDTSEVTQMIDTFSKTNFCGDVSKWNVSNVASFHSTFAFCKDFDCDLSQWETTSVNSMIGMFWSCVHFLGKGLEKWDMSNVSQLNGMFYKCESLKGDTLVNWKFESLENTRLMFNNCIKLNVDLSKWNVEKLFDTYQMFEDCVSLEYVPKWDLSNAFLVESMFKGCTELRRKKDFSNITISKKTYNTSKYKSKAEWLYSLIFDMHEYDVSALKKAYPGIILPKVK